MVHVVTALFAIQVIAGLGLFVRWWRAGRPGAPPVLTHVAVGVISLVLWITFTVTDAVVWGWLAFVGLTVGNTIGDGFLLVGRWRRLTGRRQSFFRDYGAAIAGVFRGALPPLVAFHAAFAGAVYFPCLGVCIGATIAAVA